MSGYRQIILHAGLSKTGSTSIQAACQQHRAALSQHGIVYPVFSFAGKAFGNHSTALVTAIASAPGKYGLGLKRQYGTAADSVAGSCREQLDGLLADPRGDILVLSSERIAGLDDDDMQALRQRLAPHARQLRVIAYIRSPHSALESILQERVKAGAIVEPGDIVGRVRRRYEALERGFGDLLEPINYHEAIEVPGGVAGSFLSLAGYPLDDIAALSKQLQNPRISMEAFQLMDAINRRYPKQAQHEHGVERYPGDLGPLVALPGQGFRLRGFTGSEVHGAALAEARWLESRLGFRFPAARAVALQPLWQDETLSQLEPIALQFKQAAIRSLLADLFTVEAQAVAAVRPATANALASIASRLEGEA